MSSITMILVLVLVALAILAVFGISEIDDETYRARERNTRDRRN